MKKEIWKDIPGYESYYQASTWGRIKSLERINKYSNGRVRLEKELVLKLRKNKFGYLQVILTKNNKPKTYQVHRLVALTFLENIENKPCVNHINGIKDFNKIDNLEWVTHKENTKHMYDILDYKVSDETKNKLSNSGKGRKHKEESKRKISISKNKKIIINGINFTSIEEASLYHGKRKTYFSGVIRDKKKNINTHKKWNIELTEVN